MSTHEKPETKEESAKKEAAKSPDRDDVHEQRQEEQPAPGLVDQSGK